MTEQHEIRTPGLGKAVDDIINAWTAIARTFYDAWAEVLNGVPIIESELIAPGDAIRADGKIYLHPIDILLITGDYPPGIEGALAASLDWQLARIAKAATAATTRIEAMHR